MSTERSVLALALALATLTGCESDLPGGPGTQHYEVDFVDNAVESFGTFDGVAYVRHVGRFEGTTELGFFRVPYEIIAPEDPALGNETVLVEPPHFSVGRVGREAILGHPLLFGNGFSYAAVGFGENGLNILDPTADDAVIGGAPVENPGELQFALPPDVEILIQFVNALTTEPFALGALGTVSRRYAYGASQTAAALLSRRSSLLAARASSI